MIIFDFDQTLVDTEPVQPYRLRREWGRVMAKAPTLKVYEGINELLGDLKSAGHQLAIVTHSPDMVPKFFIGKYKWPIEIVIGPHQAKVRKPAPGGLLMALRLGQEKASETYHVGDSADDTAAARAAGMIALGAGWGALDLPSLTKSAPDHLLSSVSELRKLLIRTGRKA